MILNSNGFIMLNEDMRYPSICSLNGDWGDVCELIVTRSAYLTKLIDNKSTFLSPKLYKSLQDCSSKVSLNHEEEYLYDFIKSNEPVNTDLLRRSGIVERKQIRRTIERLQKKLLITAIGEDVRISNNWGTFLWGTSETWEINASFDLNGEDTARIVEKYLRGIISERKLKSLTSRINEE